MNELVTIVGLNRRVKYIFSIKVIISLIIIHFNDTLINKKILILIFLLKK